MVTAGSGERPKVGYTYLCTMPTSNLAVYRLAALYTCEKCGAMVTNCNQHTVWHEANHDR